MLLSDDEYETKYERTKLTTSSGISAKNSRTMLWKCLSARVTDDLAALMFFHILYKTMYDKIGKNRSAPDRSASNNVTE